MKEKIKRMMFTVVLVVITIILSTILSVYATTTILGSEVGYTDNKGIGASNVQAAIDATYSSALSLDSRVTTLEKVACHDMLYEGTLTMPSAISSTTYTYTTVSNLNKYYEVSVFIKGMDAEYGIYLVDQGNPYLRKTFINNAGAASDPYMYSVFIEIYVDFSNNRIGVQVRKMGSGWTYPTSSIYISRVIGRVKN